MFWLFCILLNCECWGSSDRGFFKIFDISCCFHTKSIYYCLYDLSYSQTENNFLTCVYLSNAFFSFCGKKTLLIILCSVLSCVCMFVALHIWFISSLNTLCMCMENWSYFMESGISQNCNLFVYNTRKIISSLISL